MVLVFYYKGMLEKVTMRKNPAIADLHVAVIWLQLPKFLSFFLSYLNFEFPARFK